MDIEKEIVQIEKAAGKFVANCEVIPGRLKNEELLFYGPGDLVLDVWNFQIRLLLAVRRDTGHGFTDALSSTAYEQEDVQEWLQQALEACHGAINRSGQYPLAIPVPEWLEPEIIITVLG